MDRMLISGGAGFIGVNAADYFVRHGYEVTVLDNLSRQGTEKNLHWLQSRVDVDFEKVDVRDAEAVARVVKAKQPDVLLHLAAQVAVTTSVENPRLDFDINAMGTLNLLEAVRLHSPNTFFINASTNKVYGKMDGVEVEERNGRYVYKHLQGADEYQPIDFYSPYGCSKGVADLYALDYSRIYDLRTVSFRQSCIYGTRQFGNEDQGWVAWFTIAAMLGKQITIYGDGKQIRDILFVEDLIRAYEAAINDQDAANGQAFNMGGGPENTLSLLELVAHLRETLDIEIPLLWGDWRPGDQRVFVCNIDKAKSLLHWQPQVSVHEGLKRLTTWIDENRTAFV